MKIEIKAKDTFQTVLKALTALVGGKYEVKPGIWLECPSDLSYRLRKDGSDIVVEFPKSKLKVSAARWIFQMDGFIEKITIKSDQVLVNISNLPDLQVVFI